VGGFESSPIHDPKKKGVGTRGGWENWGGELAQLETGIDERQRVKNRRCHRHVVQDGAGKKKKEFYWGSRVEGGSLS